MAGLLPGLLSAWFKRAGVGQPDAALLANGTPARAGIVDYDNHWPSGNAPEKGSSTIILEVRPPDGPPYQWKGTKRVIGDHWFWATNSSRVPDIPVRVDPADHSRLEIDWDTLGPEVAAARAATPQTLGRIEVLD